MDLEAELVEAAGRFHIDPLGFVLYAYPWSEPGPLKDHPGPDKWQLDFLRGLGEEVRSHQGKPPYRPIRRAVSSGHGVGKAQPVSLMLHTPDGLRRWGDLKPGETVFGSDGKPTRIIAVHERGKLPIFRMTFDDRSSTRTTGDHVWSVKGRNERRTSAAWAQKTTAEIAAAGVKRANGISEAKHWEIPTQGPAEFQERAFSIHPYVLGVWLGDGGRVSALITSADSEVPARIAEVGENIKPKQVYAWRVKGLRVRLRALGVLDRYSYQKSVPASYMEAPAWARAEMLRGLLDTDGECSAAGTVVFSSTSRALADDVVWLARSLGGKAMIQPTVKHPKFPGPDGVLKDGFPCWRATVTMPDGFQCFYVKRKQERVPVQREARYLSRWIASIEPDGEEEARCITVAAPDGLYQTNDFIVTHNSTMVAWLVDWIMVTRPGAQGTVTANTFTQLETKTWAAIEKWTKLCIFGHWFTANAGKLYVPGKKEDWFCAPQSSKEENSEAFAGQHAAESTSFYCFDEDSGIPEVIHEVAEGGLTDGEPMIFLFGNPTRNTGHFHQACFGAGRDRWNPISVDSRESRLTNKGLINEWIEVYGEDSDFVRVRVKGLPPRASELQFIDQDRVWLAQRRISATVFPDEPLIAGVDVSDGGAAWNVIRFRRGADARSIPPIRIPGEAVRHDRSALLAKLADVLDSEYDGARVSVMFIDSAFGAPYVERLQTMGHRNVVEVRFGSESLDRHQANLRAYMWSKMKEWLPNALIDQKDSKLETDLTSPGFHINRQDKLVIESKEDMAKRGMASPDDGDALALTFAAQVKPKSRDKVTVPMPGQWGWS